MRSDAQTTDATIGASFEPLAPLLQSIPPDSLDAARRRLAELDRAKLINLFNLAFAGGKRLTVFLAADELTGRGIPPAFRGLSLSGHNLSLDRRFDLLLADFRWLRAWHPEHVKKVRYQRCRALLTGSETQFHREAEYAFYQGKRPVWKIVASLSLTEYQQWDCALLRSVPIKKRAEQTQAKRSQVFGVLKDDLQAVRRTKAFTEADANAALLRRHALWLCSRMANVGSPSEVAARYMQLTGEPITRQVVAKQLEKLRETLRKFEMTSLA